MSQTPATVDHLPSGAPGRRSRLVRYLAVGYTLVVVYATLYPFARWRVPAEAPFAFLLAPWPRYYTLSDVLLNVLGYVPLGFLLALALLPLLSARTAAVCATLAGTLLCLGLEAIQQF